MLAPRRYGADVRERYVVTNGVRLFAVESGSGPLVLLVHGFPECWFSWRHQLAALADAGFRALAIDLPGYGHSDKPDVTYDEPWINDCIAGLVPELGADRCVIAGHDWGGLLIWPFARRRPELVAGIIGLNTPDLPRSPMPPITMLRQIFPEQPPYLVQFQERGPAEYMIGRNPAAFFESMFRGPATHQADAFPDDVVARYVEQFSPDGSLTPPLEYYRNMDRNWGLGAELPIRIDAPALMISAENDPVLTPAMADGMEERVPNLTRVLVTDCGHWTQQEQPEATNKAMIDFLQSLPTWT